MGTKINIQSIEDGLEIHDVVTSSFETRDKTMYLMATYDRDLMQSIQENGYKAAIAPETKTKEAESLEQSAPDTE